MAEKRVYGVGLDAGSNRTRMVICALENGGVRFLGAAAIPSQGWLRGRIADQQAVTESVSAVLRQAQTAAGVEVGAVVAGMGGPTARGANARGIVEMGMIREVEQRDVNRAVDRASRVRLQEDRM